MNTKSFYQKIMMCVMAVMMLCGSAFAEFPEGVENEVAVYNSNLYTYTNTVEGVIRYQNLACTPSYVCYNTNDDLWRNGMGDILDPPPTEFTVDPTSNNYLPVYDDVVYLPVDQDEEGYWYLSEDMVDTILYATTTTEDVEAGHWYYVGDNEYVPITVYPYIAPNPIGVDVIFYNSQTLVRCLEESTVYYDTFKNTVDDETAVPKYLYYYKDTFDGHAANMWYNGLSVPIYSGITFLVQ
jgi:hypothetical protein